MLFNIMKMNVLSILTYLKPKSNKRKDKPVRPLEEQGLACSQLAPCLGGIGVGWQEKQLSTALSLSSPTVANLIYASFSQVEFFHSSLK